ncbi:MAG: SGNH/GDSL hydrolase family protein [Planctomycetaceae bacterium]|nr:SGNH/GDSL hydrolase family protein [Planctomycetaceae bacterium]
MNRQAIMTWCLLVLFVGTLAAESPKPVTSIDLQDGDAFVFLGDSITHQCLYTQYVEDYFYTRYPERRIHFYNSGVSGDKAGDALARFEGDVALQTPKYVSVLLGMNDGTYRHFDRETFDRYETDMTQLIERIASIKATGILMGPSMYDSRVSVSKPPRWVAGNPEQVAEVTGYYAPVLAFYGAWVRDQATHRGLGYVDMQNTMEQLTRAQRVENPEFNMIPDAVHPDANGQAVMAFAMLEQMSANRQVSAINATKVNDKWRVTAGQDEVADVQGDDVSLSFTFKAGSLPWVLPPEAQLGYALTKSGHKLSNERVRVLGLAPGKYDVRIDGATVGTYTHAVLAAKIELQANDKTPQYQQALAVANLNKERNEKAIHPLRDKWAQLRNRFTRPGKTGTEEHKEYLVEFNKEIEGLNQLAAEYEAKIYEAARPVARKYEIVAAVE